MEALIMSCSTGGGHNSAGQAVADELKRRGHQVTVLDPYELAGKNTAKLIGNSYVKLVQKSPKAFGVVYSLGEAYRHLPIHSPVYVANKRMISCTQQYLSQHHYDIIIMSHMYPAHILTNLKEKHIEIPKTVLIATDYTCIPFMEEGICDYYVIPSEELREEFTSKGIPADRILPFGIPVKREFSERSILEARKALHFEKNHRYVLLSGGSIGAGKIKETVKACVKYLKRNPSYRLVIICGNNEKLYRSLQADYGNHAGIHLLRSTTRMADYLKACDVFISKPGGLSSTEAAVSGKPLIHIAPIPGCESRNVAFFQKRGMSLYVKNPGWRLQSALKRLENRSVAAKMEQAQSRYINREATVRLCDFIERQN